MNSRTVEQDRFRNRRKHAVRPRTVNIRFLPKAVRAGRLEAEANDDSLPTLPKTRGDCAGVARPCPFVSCRHNLFLEARSNGSLRLLFPDLEPDEMNESCALDVADRGGLPDHRVAANMNIVRERARQLEESALVKIRVSRYGAVLEEYARKDTPPCQVDRRSLHGIASQEETDAVHIPEVA